MLHDEAVYEQPGSFIADRFLSSSSKPVQQDPRTLVFGFGRRYRLIYFQESVHFVHTAIQGLSRIAPRQCDNIPYRLSYHKDIQYNTSERRRLRLHAGLSLWFRTRPVRRCPTITWPVLTCYVAFRCDLISGLLWDRMSPEGERSCILGSNVEHQMQNKNSIMVWIQMEHFSGRHDT